MKKLPSYIGWNITKCRGYQRRKSGSYVFWIVDYDMYDVKEMHILEMRNKKLTKTKYFHTEEEVKEFIKNIID